MFFFYIFRLTIFLGYFISSYLVEELVGIWLQDLRFEILHFISFYRLVLNLVRQEYKECISAGVDAVYYEPVIEGMSRVVNLPGGTGYKLRIPTIKMCGKTGTAQNPLGENHAVFFAFAPRVNPKIAIAVFVENAGYGGTWAGPIYFNSICYALRSIFKYRVTLYQTVVNSLFAIRELQIIV